MTTTIDYKAAGVDIAAGNESVRRIKSAVESTFTSAVLTPLGGFGSLYDLKEVINRYKNPVLVQSIDGVGTKTIIAKMMNCYDTLGIDLVSATANDIIVLGAKPLTLLDYIANDKLDPIIVESLVQGMVQACLANQISLVGGETAEMPGTYLPGEHDLVGIITGVVDKDKIITGKHIVVGDQVLGFASSGLHTNGYSLARKLLFDVAGFGIDTLLPELNHTLGKTLLAPHLNYTMPIHHLLTSGCAIHGMAHITGGGLLENIPRVLPTNVNVQIHQSSWQVPAIFRVLQQLGHLPIKEMFRTFNMGIGMVMIVPPDAVASITTALEDFPECSLQRIGEVVPGVGEVELCA